MHLVYDVYKTPDKKEHLIINIGIYAKGSSAYKVYVDEESKYAYRLDREDWGLNFEIVSATPSGVTLNCTQVGGQQIGDLKLDYIILHKENGFGNYVTADSDQVWLNDGEKVKIKMNGSSTLAIDLAETYGTLSSGKYLLTLHISDLYDKSEVHPLMENYYDSQDYMIEFTIP